MHILTFDIEAWYHLYPKSYKHIILPKDLYPLSLEKETRKIFHLLEQKNLKATFFWLGGDAKKHPGLVRELYNYGHEIGVHSFSHLRIKEMDKITFKLNTEKTLKIIEDITGEKVKSYRAPDFSITKNDLWALEILKDLGFERDCSTIAGSHFGGRIIPSAPFLIKNNGVVLKEFPVSSFSFLSYNFKYGGSGYFRITPYRFLYRKMTTSPYVMSYFHPRDFDTMIHKKIKWNPYLKLKYRMGARRAFRHLGQLFEVFPWIPLREAENRMDWEEAEVVEI